MIRVYAFRGFTQGSFARLEELLEVTKAGADGLVVDVYSTRDRIPVVVFDRAIGGVDLSSLSYGELRSSLQIPDVRSLITTAKGEVVLWVRDSSLLDVLPKLVESTGALERSYIAVDNVLQARVVRGISTSVKLVLRISNPFPNVTLIRREGINALAVPPPLVKPRLVRECTSRGITVIAWLVNDVAQATKAVRYGVEVLVTSSPTLRRELERYI